MFLYCLIIIVLYDFFYLGIKMSTIYIYILLIVKMIDEFDLDYIE